MSNVTVHCKRCALSSKAESKGVEVRGVDAFKQKPANIYIFLISFTVVVFFSQSILAT